MKSISLSIIIDAILSFLSVTILVICFGRLTNLSSSLIFPLSIVIGLCFCSMFTISRNEKAKKHITEKGVSEKKNQLQLKLALMPNNEIIELFKGIFDKIGISHAYIDGFFKINENYLKLYFSFEPLSVQTIVEFKKQAQDKKKLIIVGSTFSDNAVQIAKQCSVQLVGIEQVFALIKSNQPELISETILKKSKKKLNVFFKHSNSRKFILYGIVLDIMGLISFYPIYYFVFGTFFIICGLISLFYGIKEQAESLTFESIFDNKKHD